MNQFLFYFRMQFKRISKLFPRILFVTGIFLFAGLAFLKSYTSSQKEEQSQILTIGITASDSDLEFMNWGITLLENIDQSKFTLSLEMVTVQEGELRMDQGSLDAWIILPEDYIQRVYHGEEVPMEFRFGRSQSGITSVLVKQLANTVAEILLDSKAAVYAFQDTSKELDLDYRGLDDELSFLYIGNILQRSDFTEILDVSSRDDLDPIAFYCCIGLLMLLLFWGLNCGTFLSEKDPMFQRLLARRGLSVGKQLLGKYLCLLTLFFFTYSIIAVGVCTLFYQTGAVLPGLEWKGLPEWIHTFVCFTAVLPPICGLVLWIYETAKDAVGGTLFFFFLIVILGFLSGFFYPMSFFPEWMQKIAQYLPARVLFEYAKACMTQISIGTEFLHLYGYTGILVLLSRIHFLSQERTL